MNRHDNLDRLIDGALRDYSTAEPRPGLEQRVIASLRTAQPRPSLGRFSWVALAAACLLLVALGWWQFRTVSRPVTIVRKAVPAGASAPSARQASSSATVRPRPRTAILRASQPARPLPPRAPLAGPLSRGERALVALVQVAPGVAAQVSAQERALDRPMVVPQLEVSPVAVAALEVAPLEK